MNIKSEIINYSEVIKPYTINILNKSKNQSNDKDYIIETIKNELINGNLDIFISKIIEKEKKDMMIEDENIIYQLTTSYNQNNIIYNNISNIILGSCETKLKLYNNISENSSLLILKMDIYEKGLLIPTIEYEVFNIETKEPLDLNLCKDIKIKLNIPVNIDEKNLFKYNSSN